MAKYQLTNEADLKIDEIYEYSILNFGLEKAQEYIIGMHDKFELLANNPSWGNDYGAVRTGLCRYEYVSHAIYFQETDYGILIVQILGGAQDPAQHITDKI